MKSKYIRGKHKFECMYCHGWYLSDKKRIRYDNLVTCNRCWFPKPWFMHKMPNIGNELKVVNHPSGPPAYQYVPVPIESVSFIIDGIVTYPEDL